MRKHKISVFFLVLALLLTGVMHMPKAPDAVEAATESALPMPADPTEPTLTALSQSEEAEESEPAVTIPAEPIEPMTIDLMQAEQTGSTPAEVITV